MVAPVFPDQINGFLVAPVVLRSSDQSPVYHTIYIKRHQAKQRLANDTDNDDDDQDERTIFAVNLPSLTTFAHVKQFCLKVADVLVEDFISDPNIPNTGRIILVDKPATVRMIAKLKPLYKQPSNAPVWSPGSDAPKYGRERYIASSLQRYKPHEVLQKQVDLYMLNFNRSEARDRADVKSLGAQVDEDGFTLVVSRGRKSVSDIGARTQKLTEDEALSSSATSKKRKKEKEDFYRFQIREKKKQETTLLLKKFKEDQEKIKELKEKKRFRPY